jgi:hypothetical protein
MQFLHQNHKLTAFEESTFLRQIPLMREADSWMGRLAVFEVLSYGSRILQISAARRQIRVPQAVIRLRPIMPRTSRR